jgi:hypothetical protein
VVSEDKTFVNSMYKRTPNRILQWKPIGTRTGGRPRKRWIAGTEDDLQIMGVRRWRKQREERAEWKKITDPQWIATPIKEEEYFGEVAET